MLAAKGASMNILLVEDEKKIVDFVCSGFREQGFTVEHCADGHEGFAKASAHEYDLIVLDIMLPGRDGLSILKALRKAGNSTPILLLTARNELDDRIEGLNLGADDYLAKPFLSRNWSPAFTPCGAAYLGSVRIS
ncbi:hypothetical protein CCP4SC76_5580020 [Gammaproteobacteria bacterium]